MIFHESLKAHRVKLGLTQKEMATLLGITDRGYRNYEIGRNQPSIDDLIKIADLFNVSLDELVGRAFPKDTLVDSE